MSYSVLEQIEIALNRMSLKQIMSSFIGVMPIYKKLALDEITDDEVPLNAKCWVNYIDIFAIQTNRYGYFEHENVLRDFELDLISKLYSFKTHREIKQFITNLYLFECNRNASIEQWVKDHNATVIRI